MGIILGHLEFITVFAKQFRRVKIHTNAYLNLRAEETLAVLVTSLDNCPFQLQKKIPSYVFNLT